MLVEALVLNRKMKIGCAALVAVTFAFWGYHKFQRHGAGLAEFVLETLPAMSAPPAGAASTPKVYPLDPNMLAAEHQKLVYSCAHSPYAMTEELCVQSINDRRDRCQQWTAQKYEVQPPSMERMMAAVSSYTDCLFEFAASKTG